MIPTPLRVLIEPSANPILREILAPPHFEIVGEGDRADAIIFERDEPGFVRKSPYFQKWREKCIVLSEGDLPTFFLPAIYAANHPHLFGKGRAITYSYFVTQRFSRNAFLAEARRAAPEKKYLVSFLGGSTSWVRKRLFRAVDKMASPDVLIRSTDDYCHWDWSPERAESRRNLQRDYAEIMSRSAFFLCPRGAGSSSIRLFEVMEMGVCPIIFADDYIFPEGPNWEECALIVRERDVTKAVDLARAHAGEAAVRGRQAREAFETYFSNERHSERLAGMIARLLRDRNEFRERVIHFVHPLFDGAAQLRGNLRRLAKGFILRLFHLLGLKLPYRLNRPIEEQIGVNTPPR